MCLAKVKPKDLNYLINTNSTDFGSAIVSAKSLHFLTILDLDRTLAQRKAQQKGKVKKLKSPIVPYAIMLFINTQFNW